MRKDFLEYLPYIIVSVFVVSSIVIFKRGDFYENRPATDVSENTKIITTNSPSPLPTNNSTTQPIQIVMPEPTIEPIIPLITKPSINRVRGGDDDDD